MFLTILSILLVVLILYILFVPIVLCIDSTTNQYYVRAKGLAKASIENHDEELLRINLKVAFLHFYFFPLRKIGIKKRKSIKEKNTGKRHKRIGIRTLLRMLKSFKVKRLYLDIDTGNYILNARLYSMVGILNYTIGSFNINFEGRNQMALHMQNRPIDIIRSFIKT